MYVHMYIYVRFGAIQTHQQQRNNNRTMGKTDITVTKQNLIYTEKQTQETIETAGQWGINSESTTENIQGAKELILIV